MKLITKSGSVYQVLSKLDAPGFVKVQLEGHQPQSAVFVGERRHGLVQDMISGRRELVRAKDPNGDPALGFSGSSATLAAGEPHVGMRILSGYSKDGELEWSRYSTPIVRIEG